ncbi:MAG: NADH-quinone oxidoreductase subunit A, partial [Actinobacteria bacterium]|nr:NADH-quinone oxidoreductase subunit A [Actinomycetota bacterium]
MNVYIPILVLGAIAAAFAVGSVGIALVIGPRRYNRAKLEAYECGIEPMAPVLRQVYGQMAEPKWVLA